MNKTELIAAVAEKASISKKESEVVINAALDTIIDSLKNDEKVQLVGFGSFETKHRAERTGRNPKTKESITIAASKVPTFKAGKAFKGRTVANEACDGGRVTVNGKVARASYDVKAGDVIALHFGERVLAVEVLDVSETAGKSEASLLYREVNAQ